MIRSAPIFNNYNNERNMTYDEIFAMIQENDKQFMKPVDEMTNREIVEEYVLHGLNYLEPSDVLEAFNDEPENIMGEEQIAFYNSIPDQVEIYRGCSYDEVEESGVPEGISWTLDYKVAEFFAYRYGNENGCIVKAIVPKTDIRYATNDRNEKEVIVIEVDECEVVSHGETDYDPAEYHKYLETIAQY